MNRDLQDLIVNYATLQHNAVTNNLLEKSKDNIIAILMDLLANYFNDKNSSSLREFVIVTLCGFQSNTDKIGYNGYRQNAIGGKTLHCEAKPKNINTNDAKLKKLNGSGNFTDYTWGRFKRDTEENPLMILGGFIDGRLIYIFTFYFTTTSFLNRLEDKLTKHFPDGDVSGRYLRSADFRLADYEESLSHDNIKVLVDKASLTQLKPRFTKNLYAILETKAS